MKETAIQWLLEELDNGRPLTYKLIEQAKEIENKQRGYSEEDMRNAFDSAREFNSLDGVVDIHIVLPMGGDMSDLQPLHFTFEEFIEQFKKKQYETTL